MKPYIFPAGTRNSICVSSTSNWTIRGTPTGGLPPSSDTAQPLGADLFVGCFQNGGPGSPPSIGPGAAARTHTFPINSVGSDAALLRDHTRSHVSCVRLEAQGRQWEDSPLSSFPRSQKVIRPSGELRLWRRRFLTWRRGVRDLPARTLPQARRRVTGARMSVAIRRGQYTSRLFGLLDAHQLRPPTMSQIRLQHPANDAILR